VIDTLIIRNPKRGFLYLVLMWSPGLSALACRLVFREGLQDISLRLFGRRGLVALGIAWLYPLVVAGVAYGAAYALGLARFSDEQHQFWRALAFFTTLGVPLSALSAAGEELGWRGYMLTRLVTAGVPMPRLTSGVIWGAWHLPIILGGAYVVGNSWLAIVAFFVTISAAGVAIADLRLASGSVWPAVMLHAAWNADTQGVFDRFTRGGERWLGEGGLLVAAVSVAAAVAVSRHYRARRLT
jgi:membrane protease YdiL (CAAX protease family)